MSFILKNRRGIAAGAVSQCWGWTNAIKVSANAIKMPDKHKYEKKDFCILQNV